MVSVCTECLVISFPLDCILLRQVSCASIAIRSTTFTAEAWAQSITVFALLYQNVYVVRWRDHLSERMITSYHGEEDTMCDSEMHTLLSERRRALLLGEGCLRLEGGVV